MYLFVLMSKKVFKFHSPWQLVLLSASSHGNVTETKWATSWENLFMPYANNKDTDQPAHPHSLISIFVIRYLDSIIPITAKSKISRLASLCSRTGRFESFLVTNTEDRFCCDVAQIFILSCLVDSSLKTEWVHLSFKGCLIYLTYISQRPFFWDLGKQCRPRSNAAWDVTWLNVIIEV